MDNTTLQTKWEQILIKLREELAGTAIDLWIAPAKPTSMDNGVLTLVLTSDIAKKTLEDRYIAILKQVCNSIFGQEILIQIQVNKLEITDNSPEAQTVSIQKTTSEATAHNTSEQQVLNLNAAQNTKFTPEQIAPGDASSLIPKYTFDTLVKGSHNGLAYAIAEGIAKAPGVKYNPFFMYGGVGLGKTHLMHAIGHEVLKNDPNKRVLYITSERFTNELINSIRDNTNESFRQKYRNIDVLLVDDVQFLTNKEKTQEEFFHTFNALKDANKAIILSSDRLPSEIQTLEDRLRSRFEGGIMADIQQPDLETRIAILRKKATLEHVEVPNDALTYIASRITNNIRELEGGLTRVIAYASIQEEKITTELVATAFKNMYPDNKSKEITIELIQEIVASYFKLKVDDLLAKKRNRVFAEPRQIAMYLCRELTSTSLPQIGNSFGGRDHTTVMHACEKISSECTEGSKMKHTIDELMRQLDKL